MLTPADIDNKQFSTTRIKEGYDQNEVDGFLDQVVEDYKFLQASVQRLDSENTVLRRVNKSLESDANAATVANPVVELRPSDIAQRLIDAAEKAAEEHKAEAQAKADETIRAAGAEAARLIEEATAAAEKIKNDGLAEKYRRQQELEAKAERLESDVADLNDRARRVKAALAGALNSMGEVT